MSIETQMEREEDAIEEAVDCGDMTRAEANAALRDLHREARAYAQEAAQEAYDREYARW